MRKSEGYRLPIHLLETANRNPAKGLSISLFCIEGDLRTYRGS